MLPICRPAGTNANPAISGCSWYVEDQPGTTGDKLYGLGYPCVSVKFEVIRGGTHSTTGQFKGKYSSQRLQNLAERSGTLLLKEFLIRRYAQVGCFTHSFLIPILGSSVLRLLKETRAARCNRQRDSWHVLSKKF